jgi:hypothetical protein
MHGDRAISGHISQDQRNLAKHRSKSHFTPSNINQVPSPTHSYKRINNQVDSQPRVPGVTNTRSRMPNRSFAKTGSYGHDNPTDHLLSHIQDLFKRAVESQEVQGALTGIEVSDIKYQDFQEAINQIFARKSNGQVREHEEMKQTQPRVNHEASAHNRMMHKYFGFVYATLECLNYSTVFINALLRLNEAEDLKRIFNRDNRESVLRNYIENFNERNPRIKDAGMFLQQMLSEVPQLREIFWINAQMEGKCSNQVCKRENTIRNPNSLLNLTVKSQIDSSIEKVLQSNLNLYADCESCDGKVLFMTKYRSPFPKILVIKLEGQYRFRTQVKLQRTLNWDGKRYNLISICCHSQESGYAYYYSICKIREEWYAIRNGQRREIPFSHVESNIGSYIIFYERQDI